MVVLGVICPMLGRAMLVEYEARSRRFLRAS